MSKTVSLGRTALGLCGALFFGAAVFGQTKARLEQDLRKSFADFKITRLAESAAAQKNQSAKTLVVPTADGQSHRLDLIERDLQTPDYRAENTAPRGTETLARNPVTTYKGTIAGAPGSTARLTISDEKIEGYFTAAGERFFIESARNYSTLAEAGDSIVYRAEDLLETERFVCESELLGKIERAAETFQINRFQILPTYRVLEMATEADHAFVAQLGGAAAANAEILSILNFIEGDYEAELGLTFDVVFQHAWTTADPFDETTASLFLNSFRTYWNTNYPQASYPRDAAHLFSGRQSLAGRGLSYLGTVCANPNAAYGFDGRFDVGMIKYALAAHEIGHNFNASHADAAAGCANTVMGTTVSNVTPVDFCDFTRTEISNFVNASGGCLTARAPTAIGAARFDFDGDGKADAAVFRPSNGVWYITNSGNNSFNFSQFGASGDVPVPADYDGDGRTDIAIYRAGVWFRLKSTTNTFDAATFGEASDTPAPADYDGDARADLAVFRPSSGVWHRLLSQTNAYAPVPFGASGDVPLPADYDGDARADVNVFRPSNGTWYRSNSPGGAFNAVQFGASGDRPLVGDFDGDGKTDQAVFRPSNGGWFVLRSSNNSFGATAFGLATDVPAPADYDGDARADLAVFRPSSGTWYRLNSSTNALVAAQFGASGDVPVPAAYVR